MDAYATVDYCKRLPKVVVDYDDELPLELPESEKPQEDVASRISTNGSANTAMQPTSARRVEGLQESQNSPPEDGTAKKI